MPERPPILGNGTITLVYEPQRLYQVEMANGYHAYAVVQKAGPLPPEEYCDEAKAIGTKITVEFKPYDMSRCKIVEWS